MAPRTALDMMVTSGAEVRQRLSAADLPNRLTRLGFRDQDVPEVLTAVAAVLNSDEDLDAISAMADRLIGRIGDFGPSEGQGDWSSTPARTTDLGTGVLPMLALLVTAPEVTAFHTSRGVPADVSAATLSDLGQQVWVHRLTYGEFGLHTHRWLTLAWSGALYWLGRLQFNLQLNNDEGQPEAGPEWVLSTHIPRTGPLTAESVDESFAMAAPFFAAHFPDFPTRKFFCRSWLLDPALSELLPESNLAAFQRRWQVYGEPRPGEADLLFFIFLRRPPVDLATLPTDTTLRRVAAEALRAGRSWSVYDGRVPQ